MAATAADMKRRHDPAVGVLLLVVAVLVLLLPPVGLLDQFAALLFAFAAGIRFGRAQ